MPVDPRIRERRRQVRADAMRRRRRVTVSVMLLLAVAGGAYGVSRTPLFAVADVRVLGVSGTQAAQVREVAGISYGTNLLDVDPSGVARRVQSLPWVKRATVRRLPTVVELRVTARIPAAVVRLGRGAWVLDEDGWVLGGGMREGLVRIDAPYAPLPPVGERTSDRGLRNALAVHTSLPAEVRAMVDRYDASSDRGLRLRLVASPGQGDAGDRVHDDRQAKRVGPEGPAVWVRFGLAERVEAKARVILLLLEQARQQALREGTPVPEGALPPGIAELDVRAPDNPVLVPAGAAA